MASLRLKGAALACLVQSGLKATCVTPRASAHLAAMSSAPLGFHRGEGPCRDTWSDLIELAPDQAVIVEVGPAGEGDLGACGQHHLRFPRGAWRPESRGCRSALRSCAGGSPSIRCEAARLNPCDGRTRCGVIAHHVHAVAPFDQGHAFGRQALEFGGFHLGAILLRWRRRRCACSFSSSDRSIRAVARWKRLT